MEADFETYLKLAADSGGIRYEVFDGLPYSTGVPGWRHQAILLHFGALLHSYVFRATHGQPRPWVRLRHRLLMGGIPLVFGEANPAVPDLMYAELARGERLPDLEGEPLEITPDLIVEVVSVDSRLLD